MRIIHIAKEYAPRPATKKIDKVASAEAKASASAKRWMMKKQIQGYQAALKLYAKEIEIIRRTDPKWKPAFKTNAGS